MKYRHLIFYMICANFLIAQNPKFQVTPNPNSIFFISDMTDHPAHCSMINNSKTTIYLCWTREILQMTQGWICSVCDTNQCYGDFVDKCPRNKPDTILATRSALLDVHVNDNGFDGEAHVVMWVYELQDTTTKVKVDYLFNKIVSNNEVKNIEIKVYPNPAYNSFSVEYNQGLKTIEFYSILGRKICSYKAFPNRSYDISQLQEGLYFVKLIGPDGQNLRTIRLQKRSYRP